ncbi:MULTISPECIES: DNA cytosine methyltransferase [Pseudomonas aeruginosa group]|uniref:C-5 cytosine-specific DNA methylase n=1 Tax=Pseudomonas paraeruginosa (strain DSM 24068 / PA7) TaxID=381754 RepID=A6V3V6_PSEP7|nr:DNA cytosine methyltransferase [Pseudomonas aeruginosa]ABR81754.1 C-5 cytosine-specific DNA methylase [Pseudomonas aeruginosa PA7]KSG45932.1 DNA cytosine methyltransferase [Pseudomonas aeruginosa]MCW8363107.1 DNA cytosine methyltransferase [Pseudomonas aeruginosa]MCW8367088.1 DNA cytosine methyltransferase [Pseudomonas aeruginosa]MCW8416096.1 DNA cytosine methyltransferase [Pseudomonas aeruginosa]
MIKRTLYHFHFCCGLGGGAAGFNRARPRVGNVEAQWVCLGGIDVDPAGLRDFERLAGVPGTLLDLFTRDQYVRFHGKEPPAGWREATPEDVRRAAGGRRPDAVFISSPCKGASGLLSEKMSLTPKYQALNELTLRCIWLMGEAWADDPVPLIVFENVPRLASRGRHLLDQINSLLSGFGYAVAETTHDCGELGGLAQSRKRFLLVARHVEKVPPFLYEPEKKSLRAVGDILGRMPLPGDIEAAGPMHRVPSLQWKTWVRLALVRAGSDWRSLNDLAVEDGYLRDLIIVPEYQAGYMGVHGWNDSMGTIAGRSGPTNGAFSVADPRAPANALQYQQYGVRRWTDTSGAIIGVKSPGQGTYSVADPRGQSFGKYPVTDWDGPAGTVIAASTTGQGAFAVADPRPGGVRHNNVFRVVSMGSHAGTVTGGHSPSSGGQAVADPRYHNWHPGASSRKLHVGEWGSATGTVTGSQQVASGALSIADPRVLDRTKGDAYLTGGHYGVVGFDQSAGAVSASARHDNGRWSVADPRMPAANDRLTCIIQSLDGTWHRPFTTLELAALQSLVDPEEQLILDGLSDSDWRERIGNAVPPAAAEAIAGVMGTTLLLAEAGETFMLSNTPIWVRPVAVALSVAQQEVQP